MQQLFYFIFQTVRYISNIHRVFIHHLFELVLSRMQGLSDTLRQQDLMSQSLLPECHSPTSDNHHLSALILQHGYLIRHTKVQ